MGRKSRAKAARRVARERQTLAVPDRLVGAYPAEQRDGPRTSQEPAVVVPSRCPGDASHLPRPKEATTPLSGGRRQTSGLESRHRDKCAQLRALVAHVADAQAAVEDEIRALLKHGQSWTDIGRALGLTRQGARQRYRRLIDNPRLPRADSR